MADGTSRIFFDDVRANKKQNPINWEHERFFSFTPAFENAAIDNMDLSEEDFQKIGQAVVARLLALNGRVK